MRFILLIVIEIYLPKYRKHNTNMDPDNSYHNFGSDIGECSLAGHYYRDYT